METQRSRLTHERVLHLSILNDERVEELSDTESKKVMSRVVVLSLFPLPATSSSIATTLTSHRPATDAACVECLRGSDDFYVPLLPVERDALFLNRLTHGVMHSPATSVQHERLVELYVNPPGECHHVSCPCSSTSLQWVP